MASQTEVGGAGDAAPAGTDAPAARGSASLEDSLESAKLLALRLPEGRETSHESEDPDPEDDVDLLDGDRGSFDVGLERLLTSQPSMIESAPPTPRLRKSPSSTFALGRLPLRLVPQLVAL